MVNGIVTWMEIFVQLAVLGGGFLLLSSLGNSIYATTSDSKLKAICSNLVAMVTVLCFSVLAFFFDVDVILVSTAKRENDSESKYYAALIVGIFLLAVQLAQLIRLVVPVSLPVFRPYFASGGAKMERWTKLAASHKVKKMIEHALVCHTSHDDDENDDDAMDSNHDEDNGNCDSEQGQSTKSFFRSRPVKEAPQAQTTDEPAQPESSLSHSYEKASSILRSLSTLGVSRRSPTSEALLRFNIHSDDTVPCGGVVWAWKGLIWDRTLFREEGIWIFPRLAASNLGQWFICGTIPLLWVIGAASAKNAMNDFGLDPTVKLYEVEFGIAMGALAALVACLSVTLIYVPSAVSTIIRFRCGLYGSLKDRRFDVYRFAQDQSTVLFGSAFWGTFFTALVTWAAFGIIAFLLVWHTVRDVVLGIIAQISGIAVTVLFKVLLMSFLRSFWYASFYRRSPFSANILNVVFECWNLGLSTGYILARSSKLLLITILYIGRIDTPVLAPGVGWINGTIPLDSYPVAFRKDLLSHEAHRHPFLERLAFLYMLKLRHGPDFGSRAGAAWRILFVLTLMPWMKKNRHRSTRSTGQKTNLDTSAHHAVTLSELFSTNKSLEEQVKELRRENEALRSRLKERKQGGGRRRSFWSPTASAGPTQLPTSSKRGSRLSASARTPELASSQLG